MSEMKDIFGCFVVKAVERRKLETTDSICKTRSEEQLGEVEVVAMNMWPAFICSTEKNVPSASIVLNRVQR